MHTDFRAHPLSNGALVMFTQLNGVLIKSSNTSATNNFGIQALPGGPGNNIHFTTKS